jgi:molecular chaperone Hsp33
LNDLLVGAVTEDHSFRVFAARTTQTVRGILRAQSGGGHTAQHCGDLVTAAILLRATMAPQLRVQCILRGAGGTGTLVADSHPSGATRGLIQLPAGSCEVRLAEGALLQMMRTLHDGRLSQGVVQVAEGASISEAFMAYMQESEQTVTMAELWTRLDSQSAASAAGYLVQLLPGAPRRALRAMTDRLVLLQETGEQLSGQKLDPDWQLSRLLGQAPYQNLVRQAVRFECWCNELRVVAALATLKRAELAELATSGKPLEISCDYCGKNYAIPPARLAGLLDQS